MYPWFRLAHTLARGRKLAPLKFDEMQSTQHRVALFDCDMFFEMNNGRILKIFELGRWQFALRTGLWQQLRTQNWGFAVAGASVRYRKRLLPFERFEMRTRILGWDERFIYVEQGMFKTNGDCANHCLFRTAIVSNGRAVPTEKVAALMGGISSPALPNWARNWIDADAQRPWPPMTAKAN